MARKIHEVPNSNVEKVKIDDFLNNDVKDFARYCVETRACPRLSDGLRTGARKIIYASFVGDLKKKSNVKLLALVGDTLKLEYHHGDNSLHNTIVQLASDYLNRYKPLQIQGQIGYIRQTNIDVAPRYLHVSKSRYIKLYEPDSELWKIQNEEGNDIEPETFYPIVPTTLLYRTNSPGFGFSFRSFSYTLDSIIDNCIHSIFDGTCSDRLYQLKPDVCGYDNNNFIYNYQKCCWFSLGDYEVNFDTDTLIITNLPYNVQCEDYENHLNDLKDRFIIRDFSNLSTGDNVHYQIRFRARDLQTLYRDKWRFFQTFKLFSRVKSDILNVINEYGNIAHYEDAYYFIDAFVKYRLKIYDKRKKNTISILKSEIAEMETSIKFISLVISGDIVINKRKMSEIVDDLNKHNIPEKLLKTQISKFSKEEIDRLNQKISDKKEYLDYIIGTSVEEMYLKELIELKEKLTDNVIDMTNQSSVIEEIE